MLNQASRLQSPGNASDESLYNLDPGRLALAEGDPGSAATPQLRTFNSSIPTPSGWL